MAVSVMPLAREYAWCDPAAFRGPLGPCGRSLSPGKAVVWQMSIEDSSAAKKSALLSGYDEHSPKLHS